MKAIRSALRALVLVALAGYAVTAQQPAAPPAASTPASVGISAERLKRLHAGMQSFVDRKEAAGIVTLIARDGKVVDVNASGFQDVAAKTPMRTDTLFRIASMTKPVTSVALMMLYEEGKLLLTDPVSKFIPAFKSSRVLEGAADPVAARRGINLRDLLTHRSGITYGFINGGPVGGGYRKNGIVDGLATTNLTLAEAIDKLAAEPLIAHPGAAWNYSLSTDVLGRVVEVASGMPFEVFVRERILKPLRMGDTDFVVPEAKWPRLATAYAPDGAGGIRPMTDPETFGNTVMSPGTSYKPEGKTYYSGGAGLVSTARDYARFGQMLLNGGALDGARLLSPKTVELMTASHTADLPPSGLIGGGAQFGLGFRVVTDVGATQTLGSNGTYGWSGIYGTNFWVDPKERLVAIVMVQRYPGSQVAGAFTPLVYQSLIR